MSYWRAWVKDPRSTIKNNEENEDDFDLWLHNDAEKK